MSHFWLTGLDQSLALCSCGSENRGALSWARWQGLIPASTLGCAILWCLSCLVLTWYGSVSYHLQLYRGPSTSFTSSRSCYWRGLLEQSYCSPHTMSQTGLSSRDSSMYVAEGPHQKPGDSMIDRNQMYNIGERRRQQGRFAMNSITTAQQTCNKILFYWLSTLMSLLLTPWWGRRK